jgi:CubicO group peptidase (beta-lactamase class C family)
MRRLDPRRRSLGQFFADEIAGPLGEEMYLRLPEKIPNARLAVLTAPGRMALLRGFPLRFTLETLNPRSNIHRALLVNPGASVYLDERRIYARDLEVPSGNAVATARGIAHAYSAFATDGRELGLRPVTLDLLAAPAMAPLNGFYDECMKADGVEFSLGFMKSCPAFPFGTAGSYGSPGAGGAIGFADPDMGIGYAYVTSHMGTTLTLDPRDQALTHALYTALRTQ